MIGCEPTGHYWFALAKCVTDHQKELVMDNNPFLVKKIKEMDDNSPKKTDSKRFKGNSKTGSRRQVIYPIFTGRHLCRDKRSGI